MAGHGSLPAPPDQRPYRAMSEPGSETISYTPDATGRITKRVWRQIGWQGQSGALYALGEGVSPADHEPGSFAPLWAVVESEPVDPEYLRGLGAMVAAGPFW